MQSRRTRQKSVPPAVAHSAARMEPLEGRVLLSVTPDTAAPEFRVNTVLSGQNADPDVAVDADGDSVIVWTRVAEDGSGVSTVMGQMYNRAGGLKGGEFVVNNAGEYGVNPIVSMNKKGDFVVAWVGAGTNVSYGIYARRFNKNGVPFGLQFRVNEATSNPGPNLDSRDVAIASDDAGNFVIAWPEAPPQGQTVQTVRARRYDVRLDPVGDVFRVDTSDDMGAKSELSAAMDADGDFVIVWHGKATDGSGKEEIGGRRFNKLGQAQGDDFRVDTPTVRADRKKPAVAMADDGRFVVAWADTGDGTGPEDTGRFRLFSAEGAPRIEPRIAYFSIAAFGTTSGPDVAAAADGSFVLSFDLNFPFNGSGGGGSGGGGGPVGTTEHEIYAYQFSADGDPRGNLMLVAQGVTADATGYVSVGVEDDLSDALVIWHQDDAVASTSDNNVYAIRLTDRAVAADPDPGPDPVNTPPTTTGIAGVTVDADAANTTIPLFDAFADAEDADPALRYRVISNNNANLFSSVSIDPATGVLTLDYAPGQSGTAQLVIQATDMSIASVEAPFTVTVRPGQVITPPPPGPGPGDPGLPSLAGPYAVSGKLFQKLAVAGKKKGKKAPAPGVSVFLDSDDDGLRDSNEPTATSDALGNYAFNGIAAGRYRVRLSDPGAWQIVAAKDGGLRSVSIRQRPKPPKKPGKVKPLVLQAAPPTM